jgi:hypothetical protein
MGEEFHERGLDSDSLNFHSEAQLQETQTSLYSDQLLHSKHESVTSISHFLVFFQLKMEMLAAHGQDFDVNSLEMTESLLYPDQSQSQEKVYEMSIEH